MTVTSDLTKFGFRELSMAADLLSAYANNGSDFLTDNVNVFMNDSSGKVFLSDEDFNVAVLENDTLVQFFSCPNCGYEGTQENALNDWTASTSGEERDKKDFIKYEGYCSKECLKENS